MGDPGKLRKSYSTPRHPWQRARLTEERKLSNEFGLRSKKEIWKMNSVLKDMAKQAMRLVAATGAQSEKEAKQLVAKAHRLGLLSSNAKVEDVLGLTVRDVLERRLQTILFRKGLARSPIQARQFITHRHVCVKGVPVSSPAYLVTREEESTVGFVDKSSLASAEHPERAEVKK